VEDVSFTLPVAGLTLPPAVLLVSSEPVALLLLLFIPLPPVPLLPAPESLSPWTEFLRDDLDDSFIESQRLIFILEVAREGINRSEIPISIELIILEFLRRRDDEILLLLPLDDG